MSNQIIDAEHNSTNYLNNDGSYKSSTCWLTYLPLMDTLFVRNNI